MKLIFFNDLPSSLRCPVPLSTIFKPVADLKRKKECGRSGSKVLLLFNPNPDPISRLIHLQTKT